MVPALANKWLTRGIFILLAVSVINVIPSVPTSYAVEAQAAVEAVMPSMVDLNRADMDQLQTVRGIGPALAERIIQYRDEHGQFEQLEDLTNVRGIGQAKFRKIQTQLKV